MFNQNQKRIGFACKIQESYSKDLASCKTTGTTITWLAAQPRQKAVDRLWLLMEQNVTAVYNQIAYIARLPPEQRMFRLSSDLLTAYTHEDWMWFYFQPDVVAYLEKHFAAIGSAARAADIRLSFHPGQFCVLASENPEIVERSITEFEYHVDLIRYMGYGKTFQDFKCNVHIGGKLGPEGIKSAVKRLTKEARNCLTIENAEFTWGMEASLQLVDTCALVLDIHHHWIATGEYFDPKHEWVEQILTSWCGVRPVIHYSQSREDVLVEHDPLIAPDMTQLKQLGYTRQKLRAHSEMYWCVPQNHWALQFLEWADIMCESKQKNTASTELADLWRSYNG